MLFIVDCIHQVSTLPSMSYALQTVGELLSPALKCNRGPNILCQDLLVGRKELKAVAPCNDSAGWRSGKPLFRCSCNLPAYLSLAKRGSDLALAGVSHTTPAQMETNKQYCVFGIKVLLQGRHRINIKPQIWW